MKDFIRVQKERIRRNYYRLLWWEPIWLYILNNKGRTKHVQNKLNLGSEQKRIVDELKENGIAISHVSDILGEDRWNELEKHVLVKLSDPKILEEMKNQKKAPVHMGDKYFNIDLWQDKKISIDDPLVRFCLDEKLLDIAASYMHLWVTWRGKRLWATTPVPENAPPHASQRWHRDPEDTRMLKLFIYFNDIDLDSGPFTYVLGSQKGGKWRHLFPQIPPIGCYPPNGAVEQIVPTSDIRTVTGKKGSLIFCDTSGLHKGGYCKKKPRYMSQTAYTSIASSEPISYEVTPEFKSNNLSMRALYAISY